jgi:hypothetical protein
MVLFKAAPVMEAAPVFPTMRCAALDEPVDLMRRGRNRHVEEDGLRPGRGSNNGPRRRGVTGEPDPVTRLGAGKAPSKNGAVIF